MGNSVLPGDRLRQIAVAADIENGRKRFSLQQRCRGGDLDDRRTNVAATGRHARRDPLAAVYIGSLRARFGLVLRLNPYDVADLTTIVLRSARLLSVTIDEDAAEEIARRSRGTPRIANRLLRRVRDYAQVRADGHVSLSEASTALDMLEVDRFGLDEIDQKIMMTVLEKYSGGPVGLNTVAASIDEEASTIEEVYEPYLMQLGFLDRTPRGRVATDRAFEYFRVPRRRVDWQQGLFT